MNFFHITCATSFKWIWIGLLTLGRLVSNRATYCMICWSCGRSQPLRWLADNARNLWRSRRFRSHSSGIYRGYTYSIAKGRCLVKTAAVNKAGKQYTRGPNTVRFALAASVAACFNPSGVKHMRMPLDLAASRCAPWSIAHRPGFSSLALGSWTSFMECAMSCSDYSTARKPFSVSVCISDKPSFPAKSGKLLVFAGRLIDKTVRTCTFLKKSLDLWLSLYFPELFWLSERFASDPSDYYKHTKTRFVSRGYRGVQSSVHLWPWPLDFSWISPLPSH